MSESKFGSQQQRRGVPYLPVKGLGLTPVI